ncbi:MAG: XRE family transcriptional regulator [Eubacterium sp.]
MKSTDELSKTLKNSNNVTDYIKHNIDDISNITFVDYLNQCMIAHEMTRAQVIDGADIQKNYGYQIFNGLKKPSRDKVLSLCFSMALSVDESNRLLKLSDHAILYPRIKRDSILIFALEKKQNLINTNLLLDQMGEPAIE